MFQAAVAGPPLAQDPNVQIITESLRDFLNPDETDVRLLVPVVGGSLSLGVQAVVEWAWERDIKVAAVQEQTNNLSDVEYQFLEDADEINTSLDAAATIAHVLGQALPNSCLIVAPFGEEYDDFKRTLMTLCFQRDVPIYDLSNGLMEIDPYDSWENEGGAPAEEEEKPQEQSEEAAEEAVELPQEQEEDYPAADIFEELERIERRADASAKTCLEIRDRARSLKAGRPMVRQAEPRHGIEISRNGDQGPWLPRGRGRAPGGSVERDAVTKKILRRN